MVLSYIKNQETKLKYISLWAGKETRTYMSTVSEDSLKNLLDTLKDWTKPKSDEIAAFTHLRTLNQGNKTLSTYIQEVRSVVDLCNFMCVGDCKDRLISNSIVAGLLSAKAYQQCISKGSSLSLNEYIKSCQTEDATCRQVQALCPEFTDCGDSTSVHKLAQYSQQQGRPSYRGRGPFRGGRPSCRGGPATRAWPQRDYRHSPKTVCQQCSSEPHKSREECSAIDQDCYYCGNLEHFSKVCRRNPDNHSKTEVNHIDTEEQSPDYAQSEYTTPYYITNDQTKAPIKGLKTTAKVYHIHNTDTEHIRPLWVAQS